ncbi:hypothetical protein HDU96_010242 [Phlyctochytrium bullatum]|nr:hypothetical protein HDU96_010242 [Phlyctochytrium bullatum]
MQRFLSFAFALALILLPLLAAAQSTAQCTALVNQITSAAAGTNFISESDFPWTVFRSTTPATGFPTPQAFASIVKINSVRTPEIISDRAQITTFIANRIRNQPPAKNAQLANIINSRFATANLRIYRVYETATQVQIFLVGRANGLAGCGLVGVKTTAIET